MTAHFSHTMVALSNDRPRQAHLVWAAAAIGVAAWSVWFFTAPVTLYASSQAAQIEALGAAHAIDVPMAGKLISLRARLLGLAVQPGDIIAELDATEDRLRLVEAQAALAGLQSKFEHLARQIDARQSSKRANWLRPKLRRRSPRPTMTRPSPRSSLLEGAPSD